MMEIVIWSYFTLVGLDKLQVNLAHYGTSSANNPIICHKHSKQLPLFSLVA